jgi:chaperonin GroES
MMIKPLGNRALVEMVPDEEKIGAIFIPGNAKDKPQRGFVRAVGTGKLSEKGVLIPFEFTKDDLVFIRRSGGDDVKVEGKDYKIVDAAEILAVLY